MTSSDETNPCTPVDGPQCPDLGECGDVCERPEHERGFILRTLDGVYIGITYDLPNPRHDFVIRFPTRDLVATEATIHECLAAFTEHLGLAKTPGMRSDPPDPDRAKVPHGIELKDQLDREQGGRR